MDYVDYLFAFIFMLESTMKIIGLGYKTYFRSDSNIFDFIIVVASLVSIALAFSGMG